MALLRKQAIINAVVNANDASMVSMAEASMVEDVTFMSDNPEENASLMDTSCCSKMADTTMHSIDKTDLSMFEEDMSYMEDEADDPNYSMLSLPADPNYSMLSLAVSLPADLNYSMLSLAVSLPADLNYSMHSLPADPNYSMLSLPEGECSYMDVETTSN